MVMIIIVFIIINITI